MLGIVYKNGKCAHWYTFQEIPNIKIENVKYVEAEGAELALIRKNFTNIPMYKKAYVSWEGELARFILRNLF